MFTRLRAFLQAVEDKYKKLGTAKQTLAASSPVPDGRRSPLPQQVGWGVPRVGAQSEDSIAATPGPYHRLWGGEAAGRGSTVGLGHAQLFLAIGEEEHVYGETLWALSLDETLSCF